VTLSKNDLFRGRASAQWQNASDSCNNVDLVRNPFLDIIRVHTAIHEADLVRTSILDVVPVRVTIFDTDPVHTTILDANPNHAQLELVATVLWGGGVT
jgi:hypothetical protein